MPFNTQTLNGNIFVAYDKADRVTHRQAVGRGLGVVDEFSPDGRLISRITSGGALNAPWGLAIAPASWGRTQSYRLTDNERAREPSGSRALCLYGCPVSFNRPQLASLTWVEEFSVT